MNYEDMSDFEINKRVAMAESLIVNDDQSMSKRVKGSEVRVNDIVNSWWLDPCNNPSDAWPIIIENKIAILPNAQGTWLSYGWKKWDGKQDFSPRKEAIDKNPLRAAMICFLKMKDAEK